MDNHFEGSRSLLKNHPREIKKRYKILEKLHYEQNIESYSFASAQRNNLYLRVIAPFLVTKMFANIVTLQE
jgi:hypothetical protein|tara:strand:- start:465 stop:677 length:213 start_codon:yes stop_codon:yes gene_type:complete